LAVQLTSIAEHLFTTKSINIKYSKGILIVGVIITIVIFSCKEEEEDTINLLLNSTVERGFRVPSNWFSRDSQEQYVVDFSTAEAYSPQKSLKISSQNQIKDDFAFWGQSVQSDIPGG